MTPINFSPFQHNVLDYIGLELHTSSGQVVKIDLGSTFRVYVSGAMAFESSNNLEVSYFLNQREVGL